MTKPVARKSRVASAVVFGLLWVFAYFGVRVVLEQNPLAPVAARYAIAMVPVLLAAVTILAVARIVRRLDEMQLRIQVVALSIGFLLVALLLMALALAQIAEPDRLARIRLTDVWTVLPAIYFCGLLAARRHYE